MSWQLSSFGLLALVLLGGFLWYERVRPSARVLALVAALAALAVVGRLAFAALPNVKPTTDIVLFAGYSLGALPGFAVGAVTALVSNVFLSQGPWTVWQMAGWGGVGASAALLARVTRRRELGRVRLAIACGVAGLAFGAWMDVYQWTLASRQDLDSYLAVAASSLPYNLAHAIGNVVFCMLIGPAFIRALGRYRSRLEVHWQPAPGRAAAAASVLAALALVVGAAAAPPAHAVSASKRAASYLLRTQNKDGGFPAAKGQQSSQLITGWAALGLASARHNPRDVHRRGGRSIHGYLKRNAGSLTDLGEVERTILVLRTAGLSARKFGGKDLVAKVKSRRRGDGSIAGFVSYTAFGVLALRAAGQHDDAAAASYVARSQNDNGGFGLVPNSASDSDLTGGALQALAAAGKASGDVRDRAVAYLRGQQNPDGGFGQLGGRSSNAQSTAYAVQGLVAVHGGSDVVARALAYLKGLQSANGSIRYSKTSAQTPVWVTAQALMALRRKPLPIGRVARKKRRAQAAGAAAATAGVGGAGRARRSRAGGKAVAAAPDAGPVGDDGRAGAAAAARLSRLGKSPAGAASSPRTRLVAGSGRGQPAWLVALAIAAALAAVFLARRRIGRLPGAS